MATEMTEAEARQEREQVEHVFGLTGGELADRPWTGGKSVQESGFSNAPQRDTCERPWTRHYWYEGVPEYAESDFDTYAETYRTTVECALYGRPAVELFDADGARWVFQQSFSHSGETQCPGADDDEHGGKVTAAHTAGGTECYLCGESEGDEHGYIYLGDGWVEAVYRLEDREALHERLGDAVEKAHPCRDDNSCDIAKATELGFHVWAARILLGATDEGIDEVQALYERLAPTEEEHERERVELLKHPHVRCPSCNAVVWREQWDTREVVCGSCHHTIPLSMDEEEQASAEQ